MVSVADSGNGWISISVQWFKGYVTLVNGTPYAYVWLDEVRINWGDGTVQTYSNNYDDEEVVIYTHQYAYTGEGVFYPNIAIRLIQGYTSTILGGTTHYYSYWYLNDDSDEYGIYFWNDPNFDYTNLSMLVVPDYEGIYFTIPNISIGQLPDVDLPYLEGWIDDDFGQISTTVQVGDKVLMYPDGLGGYYAVKLMPLTIGSTVTVEPLSYSKVESVEKIAVACSWEAINEALE